MSSRSPFFTVPKMIKVGDPVKIYYNRTQGPLPRNCMLGIKYGINKWEEIISKDMIESATMNRISDDNWWEVEIELHDDLFQFDFVIIDKESGIFFKKNLLNNAILLIGLVDNNESSDFRLKLVGGITEEAIFERKLEQFEEDEQKRHQKIIAEIKSIKKEAKIMTEQEIEKAFEEYWKRFDDEKRNDARRMVDERKSKASQVIHGAQRAYHEKIKWIGTLRPGRKSKILYNRNNGSLSGSSGQVRIHLNTDNWFDTENKVNLLF